MVLERLRARAEAGQAVLASLHDLPLAARFAHRVAVLDHGSVAADAQPLAALTPEVLQRVFGLSARWVEGPDGPLLSAGRAPAAQGS
jgi:iron complex transport system ATP-binding protein